MIKQLDFNNGTVRAAVSIGRTLYLGGFFSSVNGLPRKNLAAVDLDSGELLPFSPFIDGTVLDLANCNGVLALGGVFNNINSQPMKALAIYDPNADIFYDAFSSTGYSLLALQIPAIVFKLEYHNNSGVLYFGGQYGISNGTTTAIQLCGLHVQSATIKPFNLGFPVSTGIPTLSQSVCRSFAIDQTNDRLFANTGLFPNIFRSFNIGDPDNITQFTWAATGGGGNFKVYYFDPYVYLSTYSFTVNGHTRGFMATDATDGTLVNPPDVSLYKQQFMGDMVVNAALKSGDYLYLGGNFTSAKTPISVTRSSFMIFDLGNNAAPVGETVDFNKWTTIVYSGGPFQSLQPSNVTAMFLDGDKIHLFGQFLAIDGTVTKNGHYIMTNTGKRVQTKYIFA